MNKNIIEVLIDRLKKINIDITFVGNYPWIYLDTVCGHKVKERYEGNHGFTAFFLSINADRPPRITDSTKVFNKIREMLTEEGRTKDLEEYKNFMENYYS